MNAATKNCPFCAEPILAAAIKCKHCGSDLGMGTPGAAAKRPVTIEQTSKSIKIAKLVGWAMFWLGLIVGISRTDSPAISGFWFLVMIVGLIVAIGARFMRWWKNG